MLDFIIVIYCLASTCHRLRPLDEMHAMTRLQPCLPFHPLLDEPNLAISYVPNPALPKTTKS